jgi:hypothetical protein
MMVMTRGIPGGDPLRQCGVGQSTFQPCAAPTMAACVQSNRAAAGSHERSGHPPCTRPGRLAALVGNPNAGKTALFNRLTGSRQKVANYAGVTIERKEGRLTWTRAAPCACWTCPAPTASRRARRDDRSPAGAAGTARGEKRPDLVVACSMPTNLRRGLRLVLGSGAWGCPAWWR